MSVVKFDDQQWEKILSFLKTCPNIYIGQETDCRQRNDITQAEALIENLFADYVVADKGYDADAFVLRISKRNSGAVIPSKINRKIQRTIDAELYKERHPIECCIGKLKHFRRALSRFDKLAKNYLSFVQLAGAIVWLR